LTRRLAVAHLGQPAQRVVWRAFMAVAEIPA
jgi:hypothetical protein